MTKKRLEYIDIARGIGIVSVLIGHTIQNDCVKNIIYSFHMPLFFFISGMLFKPIDFGSLIIKYSNRMLIPFYLTSIVYVLVEILESLIKGSNAVLTLIDSTIKVLYASGTPIKGLFNVEFEQLGVIWFLWGLFFAYIFTAFSLRFKYSLLVVFFTVFGGMVSSRLVWLPLSIQSGAVGCLYVYAGYRLSGRISESQFPFESKYTIVTFIIWLIASGLLGRTVLANNTYPFGVLNLLNGFLGIYIILFLSKYIECNSCLKRPIILLGKQSLYIMCVHFIELECFPWGHIYRTIQPFVSTHLYRFLLCLYRLALAYIVAFFVSRYNIPNFKLKFLGREHDK